MIQEVEKWMRSNYPHLSNVICAIYLGVHPRTVSRMARRLGLEKSPEYLRDCKEYSLKKAKEQNSKRLKGWYSPNLQKGRKQKTI